MDKEERDKLYNKIYDDFIKLINGEIDEVIISEYELYELSKTKYFMDIDFNYVRFNTYADCLKSLGEKHNIVQEKDIRTNNYIFRKKG